LFYWQIFRKVESLYPVDYEKVSPIIQSKRLLSFRFFQWQPEFSLGCKKVIIIFAIAKRIRV